MSTINNSIHKSTHQYVYRFIGYIKESSFKQNLKASSQHRRIYKHTNALAHRQS